MPILPCRRRAPAVTRGFHECQYLRKKNLSEGAERWMAHELGARRGR